MRREGEAERTVKPCRSLCVGRTRQAAAFALFSDYPYSCCLPRCCSCCCCWGSGCYCCLGEARRGKPLALPTTASDRVAYYWPIVIVNGRSCTEYHLRAVA